MFDKLLESSESYTNYVMLAFEEAAGGTTFQASREAYLDTHSTYSKMGKMIDKVGTICGISFLPLCVKFTTSPFSLSTYSSDDSSRMHIDTTINEYLVRKTHLDLGESSGVKSNVELYYKLNKDIDEHNVHTILGWIDSIGEDDDDLNRLRKYMIGCKIGELVLGGRLADAITLSRSYYGHLFSNVDSSTAQFIT